MAPPLPRHPGLVPATGRRTTRLKAFGPRNKSEDDGAVPPVQMPKISAYDAVPSHRLRC